MFYCFFELLAKISKGKRSDKEETKFSDLDTAKPQPVLSTSTFSPANAL